MNVMWLIIAGAISGIIGGMGMGGGTLLIPILTIFLSFEQKTSQGINLLVFIPMSIFALAIHVKNKLVDFSVGLPIIFMGILFSLLGSFVANNIDNLILRKVFGIFLLVVGFYQFYQAILGFKKCQNEHKGIKLKKVKLKIYRK